MLTVSLLLAGAATAVAARTGWQPFAEPCGDGTVRLRVAAEPSVAPALRTVAEQARERHVTSDGRCLDVRVTARTGAETAAALARGEDTGHQVWVPDSALWVLHAASSGRAPQLDTAGNVASTPLTLAAVPPAAKTLGWPEKTYDWAELAAAVTGRDALRAGAADPARSATGLLALARVRSAATAAGGTDAGLRAAATARALARHTAPGDAQVLATLPRDASRAELHHPQRSQVLFLSEQAAYAHNRSGGARQRLRLFYPRDAATVLDYPYTLLDAAGLSTGQTRAASRFQTLLGGAEGRSVLRRHGFRPPGAQADPELVRTAGGREPQPTTDAPVEPPSAEETDAARGLWTVTIQSERITTVVDASASMAQPVPGRPGQTRMDVTRSALIQALGQFTADDEIGLWEFALRLDGDRDHRTLVPAARLGDPAGDGGTQRDRLLTALAGLRTVPYGATGLHDTVLAAYEQARKGYAEGRFNAVVVLTDGADQDPDGASLRAAVRGLRESARPGRPLPLIVIAIGPDADERSCRRLAEATGGSAHRVDDPAQIHRVVLEAITVAGSRTGG
ncbi:substrate-binding domain-containing protein [Streptomyces sp. JJ36]|uniref:substrate-binding domain-containing protein n=1 Tax=Streptomyces sp. JJ36 TaxID=2736645 RepID=UPI0027E3F24F|nr:substrate-binding domain-containing protein [Streptomyces sp. JJ36]